MKRLLLPLVAAIALPTAVNANWFKNKTFSVVCGISEYKVLVDGQSLLGDWREKDYEHYGLFTLNEQDKKASIKIYKKEDNLKYSEVVDVLSFNEGSIKLSRKGKYDGGKEVIATYTINRINGDFNRKYEHINGHSTILARGKCSKSDSKLF
tara:strand:+ start:122 stop:577 length:456 start_codon:yes stop_codon:yes gene_type:complete